MDESFNEVFVNFVRIEAVCFKCHSLFPLKTKLYMHIKSDYVGRAEPSTFPQPSLSIPVIILRAVYGSLGWGFGFKG